MRPFRPIKETFRGLYAVLCAVWLYMFFPPMSQLGVLTGTRTFVIPFIILTVSLIFRSWWIRVLGGLVVSFTYVDYFWHPEGTSFLTGLLDMPSVLFRQVILLLENHTLNDPLQTFIFLWVMTCVLWLVTYASHRSRLWLFYNALAIAVLAAIDGNTDVHPNVSIVVIVLLCLIVLGLNQLERIHAFAPTRKRLTVRFLAPLAILLLVSTVVALGMPKQPAVWANPFGPSTGGSGSGTQTIGYQLDDSQLGGSFVTNADEVMDVYSPYPTYLRGQTLSDYTGKGWKLAHMTDAEMSTQSIGVPLANPEQYTFHNLPTQTFNQIIQVKSNRLDTTDLFGGYAVNEVSTLPGAYQNQFTIDTVQGNIRGSKLKSGQSYTIQTKELRAPYDVLAKDTVPYDQLETSIPLSVRKYDLQLPTVPVQILNLAHEIVQRDGGKTEYQMVNAILTYLQTNYVYQTYDIPKPGPHEDYVYQFLFESRRGYCNNFSSAMAVMLRTLNIPTRWVTGFATGTQDFNYTDKVMNKYVITNDDAHSWVEVYFPKYGWIPFDPTPNFDMPFAAGQNSSSSTGTTAPDKTTTPQPQPHRQPTPTPEQPASSNFMVSSSFGKPLRVALYIFLGVVVCAGGMLLVGRRRLTLFWLERKWDADPRKALQRAYSLLLRSLRREFAMQGASTLRELWPYAARAGIGQHEYKAWVQTAERVLYGGDPLTGTASDMMRQTSLKWLRLLSQSRNRQKYSIDDIGSNE
ncbi:transglutaminase family protein [Alicyclobacillus dauci]|uniref:TransglutaminaseTgpA domain-containing protein n=1 Tax=Alicyclobacillus dauci TaxID=1475485 RepID=A0ABY6Z1Q0_9BACL|nr:transglutaminaseTgpA domain-containing protein [Alicyclobacillus dauci]WAH36654.1 transglutaminaseTgpA domain-containing protein [Alicyclobacillus dauci]